MKICKVKPDNNHCCCCVDDQVNNNTYKDCTLCILGQPDCELLSLSTTIFGRNYAFILSEGMIQKVKLERVRYVRDKE